MSENRNRDGELFEIKPDDVGSTFIDSENDDDIKIAAEPPRTEGTESRAEGEGPAPDAAEAKAGSENEGIQEEGESPDASEKAEADIPLEENMSGDSADEELETEIEAALDASIEGKFETEPAPEPDIEEIFGKELYETEHEAEESLMLETVGDSLSRELDSEIENMRMYEKAAQESRRKAETESSEEVDDRSWYAKIPVWGYAATAALILIIAVILWFRFSSEGQRILIKVGAGYVSDKVNYAPAVDVSPQLPVDEVEDEIPADAIILPDDTVVATPTEIPRPTDIPENEEEPVEEPVTEARKVVNILLLGEEAIGSSGRGRTDLMMLATINTEKKTLSITSLMRDVLVSIPGYSDNKLNAAYTIDGVKLLYDVLELNFGVRPDNYILVNFDSFASIIDYVGGVDMNITSAEAYYLNTTNYISKEENRNIKEGMNHLNGDQALGYCRIRKVATADHEYMDFGRTARQRKLLDSLFKRGSELSYMEMLNLADNCLPMVTTDLTAEDIELCAGMLFEVGVKTPVSQYRIPVSGTFSEAYIRNMLVTKIDLEANQKALREIIYGE